MIARIQSQLAGDPCGPNTRPCGALVIAKMQRPARRRLCLLAVAALLALCSAGPAFADTALPSDAVGPVDIAAAADSTSAEPLRVVYFHSPTCHDCLEVKRALPGILRPWGSKILLVARSIDDIEVFNELFLYEQHYGAKVNAPPVVFIGSQYLSGPTAIISRLDDVIARELAKGSATFWPPKAAAAAGNTPPGRQDAADVPLGILSRFESFGPGAVAIAGLIDGVNPCAFTTIVFFLSMLAYLKKTRRQMPLVGAGFTVGMLAAYLLLGLGLLGAVKVFSVSHGLSSGLACGVAILAFALAGWSLIDAIRYVRTGDTKQVTLGLPKKIKDRIQWP